MNVRGLAAGAIWIGLAASWAQAQVRVPMMDFAPHPQIVADREWAGVMVIAVIGLFITAAIVGPVVRANLPDELPPVHSYDEPPGTSGHHGPGGLMNPDPEQPAEPHDS